MEKVYTALYGGVSTGDTLCFCLSLESCKQQDGHHL